MAAYWYSVLDLWNELTDEQFVILLLACLPLVILLSGTLVRYAVSRRERFDIFDPVFVVAGAVFIGATLRTFYLLLDHANEANHFVLLGPFVAEDVLLGGLLAICLGIFAWTSGYRLMRLVPPPKRITDLSDTRLLSAIKLIIPLCIALNIFYFYVIGLFSGGPISGKRFFVIGSSEEMRTTYAFLRLGSDAAATCTILYACYFYRNGRKTRDLITLFFLFLVASSLPFVASVRGEIVYLLFALAIVRHYMYRPLKLPVLAFLLAASFSLLAVMQELRREAYNQQNAEPVSIVETMVYSAHFVGVGKTSVIVEKVPRENDFLYGSSYAALLIAPVPRVIWPDKPVVRIGQFVGIELFERETVTGVPPGLIGEAYLNFGWFGVFIVCLLFGLICGWIYQRFGLAGAMRQTYWVGLYAIFWITILDVVATDFVGNIMRLIKVLTPFLVIVVFAATSKRLRVSTA